jgi:hypothetical protein
MATLRRNQLRFPKEHPLRFREGIIIYGLEVDRIAAFDDVMNSLQVVAQDADLTLVPVYSNVRSLDDDWQFWEFEWEGSVYSSVAHALSGRLTQVSISATYDVPNMNQLGSHPLLDANYSSGELRVRHDGLTMSRFEKTRLISEWKTGFQHLRVCNMVQNYKPLTINCGRCEKCVRTMLTLLALGVLDKTDAFGERDVTAEVVKRVVKVYSPYLESCYRDLLPPLAALGRHDLTEAISEQIALRYPSHDWKTVVGHFDAKFMGGTARRLKHLFLGPGLKPNGAQPRAPMASSAAGSGQVRSIATPAATRR